MYNSTTVRIVIVFRNRTVLFLQLYFCHLQYFVMIPYEMLCLSPLLCVKGAESII